MNSFFVWFRTTYKVIHNLIHIVIHRLIHKLMWINLYSDQFVKSLKFRDLISSMPFSG